MAIYHFSAKPISRKQGRSTTASAAYRSGSKIVDERTGEVHDYTRKAGVLHSEMILPKGGTVDRAEFWNAIEKHHKRGDAVLSREVEISLPTELTPEQRKALAVSYARELADRYSVGADIALHAPRTVTDKDLEKNPDQYYEIDPETGRKHNGNWHAHIMLSACYVEPDCTLGKKAVELDPIACQRPDKNGIKHANAVEWMRPRWAELVNAELSRNRHAARVDHRTLKAQGADRVPTAHLGPSAAGYERRTGLPSDNRVRQEADKPLASPHELDLVEQSISNLSGELDAAKAERDSAELSEVMEKGKGDFKARYAAYKAEQEARAAAERQAAEEQQKAAQQAKDAEAQQKAAQQAKEAADAARAQAEAEAAANERRAAQIEAFRLSRGRDFDR
jgi:ATP-dependent exoDNAse (exonuclease V) alpha subunit